MDYVGPGLECARPTLPPSRRAFPKSREVFPAASLRRRRRGGTLRPLRAPAPGGRVCRASLSLSLSSRAAAAAVSFDPLGKLGLCRAYEAAFVCVRACMRPCVRSSERTGREAEALTDALGWMRGACVVRACVRAFAGGRGEGEEIRWYLGEWPRLAFLFLADGRRACAKITEFQKIPPKATRSALDSLGLFGAPLGSPNPCPRRSSLTAAQPPAPGRPAT
jgi:hypothetical protein